MKRTDLHAGLEVAIGHNDQRAIILDTGNWIAPTYTWDHAGQGPETFLLPDGTEITTEPIIAARKRNGRRVLAAVETYGGWQARAITTNSIHGPYAEWTAKRQRARQAERDAAAAETERRANDLRANSSAAQALEHHLGTVACGYDGIRLTTSQTKRLMAILATHGQVE